MVVDTVIWETPHMVCKCDLRGKAAQILSVLRAIIPIATMLTMGIEMCHVQDTSINTVEILGRSTTRKNCLVVVQWTLDQRDETIHEEGVAIVAMKKET